MTAPASAAVAPYEALLQFLYQAPVGLVQTDNDGEVTLLNPTAARLLMPLAVQGDLQNLFRLLAPHAPDLQRRAAGEPLPGSRIGDGLRVPVGGAQLLEIQLQRLDEATLIASVTDITLASQREAQRVDAHVHSASRTDMLTGLPNRVAVHERLDAALATAAAAPDRRVAVLFLNVDRFALHNMRVGAMAADALLRQIAQRLGSLAQDETVRCQAARFGGDEFMVVMELAAAGDPVGAAARLLDHLCRPYLIDRQPCHVTVSAGLSIGAQAGTDRDALVEDAGLAMRQAKRAGGGRLQVFDPSLKSQARQRAQMEADLRRALERDELFVVYQPIVALGSDAPVGFEALARWQHPERGLVSPVVFIPVAEEGGLIGAVGEFVLRSACLRFALWRERHGGGALQVLSVNLSRAQLVGDVATVIAPVRRALADSALPPQCLQLEITESLAAQDEGVQAALQALKDLGVRLALDDFGTGYSSLSSLHQLPVDVVKIDRSFVMQMESSLHHRVLVEATVRVAGSLGMQTVAEGVETPGQSALLAAAGCDKGQGYLYGKPMPPAEALEWLLRQQQLTLAS